MKKLLLSVLFLLIPVLSQAQTFNWRFVSPSGGVSTTGNTIWYNVNSAPASFPALSWTKTGTLASCTVQVDFSNDGSTVAGQAVPAQTCTSSGSNIQVASSTFHYVRASYVIGSGGGSITFIAQGCTSSTCTNSGGGSGTVNSGTINQIAIYPASAAAVSGDSLLTDDGTTLAYTGSGGASAKVIKLPGATSGTATITPPAVAGTNTNPIVISNSVQLSPNAGTQAAVQLAFNAANTGFYNTGTAIGTSYNGVLIDFFDANGLSISKALMGTSSEHVLLSSTAPSIAAGGCGGSAASIPINNGTGSFTINVGTAPTSAGCTVTLPTATTGWNCYVTDVTTNSTSVFLQKQTTSTTTSVVLVNFSDVAVATAPTASDIYRVSCFAN